MTDRAPFASPAARAPKGFIACSAKSRGAARCRGIACIGSWATTASFRIADPLQQYGHGAAAVSRSQSGAARQRPSDPDRRQLSRRRRQSLRGRAARRFTAPTDSIRRGRCSISCSWGSAPTAIPRRCSAIARARRKGALGGRRRQGRHGAVRAARHTDVSDARPRRAKCCSWSTAPTSATFCIACSPARICRRACVYCERRSGVAARPRRGAGARVVKADAAPSVIVVMGVSGSGKSTIAAMLAHRLHWIYEDADWFHPQVERREDASRRAADRRGSLALAARHRRLDRRNASQPAITASSPARRSSAPIAIS